ncbi:MAG: hypothetical protein QOE82_2564 [Thermoanaerobaculia bacterium]|nr:hypothetical protein [Thermoanaerobaculia bacterium]
MALTRHPRVSVGGGGGGVGCSSSFFFASSFFFVSDDVVVDAVSVVSVVGGAVVVVSVALVSACSRGGAACSFGIGGVVLPIVSVTTGACVIGRGRDAGGIPGVPDGYEGIAGIDDAMEPIVSVPIGFGFVGSVRLVVVSAFVFVIGGGVSPGPLMVDVTPLAEPSWTT